MPKEPEFKFIPICTKKNLNKDDTRSDREACPINTLKHLLNPSMAIPKTGGLLRSLKSKPSKPSSQVMTASSSVINKDPRSTNVYKNERSTASLCDSKVDENLCSEVEVTGSNSIFIAPTARAPRAAKPNFDSAIMEIKKAATLAFCILDPKLFNEIQTILYTYVLYMIEESGSDLPQDLLEDYKEIEEFLKRIFNSYDITSLLSTNGLGNAPAHNPCDIDNMTSVSGYVPSFQRPFQNQTVRLLDCRDSYRPNHGNNDWRMDHVDTNSVIGSVHHDENYGRFEGIQKRPMTSNASFMLQNFSSKRPGSVVGSVYREPYEGCRSQVSSRPSMSANTSVLLPSFMMNRADSAVGSVYQRPNEAYRSQMTLCNPNPSLMSYPRANSVRSDASFMYNVHRPVHSNCFNGSVMNRSNYQHMNQMDNMNENPVRSYQTSNMRSIPSVVGGYQSMQYENDEGNRRDIILNDRSTRKVLQHQQPVVQYEIDEGNRREINLNDRSTRKVLAPLQPVIYLNRVESVETNRAGVKNKNKERQADTTVHVAVSANTLISASSSLPASNNWPYPSRKVHSSGNRAKAVNASKFDSTVASRKSPRQLSHPTPARGNVMNQSAIVGVTRSGRVVRAPQNFWGADQLSVSGTLKVQRRGVKRGRQY